MLQDIRFAIRTLIKNPAFTIAAVLCLALGIGVNATIFSCVRALLLRPFPYRNPDELVAIGEAHPKRGWHMNSVSYPNFRSWQADNRTLESIGIYGGTSFNLANGDGADYVQGGNVSWTMFHVLGIAPADRSRFSRGRRSRRRAEGHHPQRSRLARSLQGTRRRDRPVDHGQRCPAHDHRRDAAGVRVSRAGRRVDDDADRPAGEARQSFVAGNGAAQAEA